MTSRLSFEKAVSATTVSEVQISPDGKVVVYTTSPSSREDDRSVRTIFLIPADGDAADGTPRQLTSSEASAWSPCWSPDGQRIAFVSDRRQRGKGQLYLMTLAKGGEAVGITEVDAAVTSAAWSPDGSMLACTAIEQESEDERAPQQDGSTASVVDANPPFAGLWVVDVPADIVSDQIGELPTARRISPPGKHIGSLEGVSAFSWVPDGSGLLAHISASARHNDSFEGHLSKVSLEGDVKHLCRADGMIGPPRVSPDAATVAFVAAEAGDLSRPYVLQTVPVEGGEARVCVPDYEGSFFEIVWLPDGRIFAVVETFQRHEYLAVDPWAGDVSAAVGPFDQPGTGPLQMSVTPDGRRAAIGRTEAESFGSIYAADVDGAPTRLVDLSPWLAACDLGEMREVRWTSFDGLKIEGLLILPVGYELGRSYPTLLNIHGGPSSAYTFRPFASWSQWGQFFAQRGYVVLMPNPRGSSGRGAAFQTSICGCLGDPDFQDLMTGIDALVDQGIADPEQLVVGGWSYGGYLTNWSITHTHRFKAAISGAGISNWVSMLGTSDLRVANEAYLGRVATDPEIHWRQSPIRHAESVRTPTLFLHGEDDPRVPVTQGEELYRAIKSLGVETQMVVYTGEGHFISQRKNQIDMLERVVDWFDSHLSSRNCAGKVDVEGGNG